jgi:hypothetical protein
MGDKISTSNIWKVVPVRNVHEYEKARDIKLLMTWLTGFLEALANRNSINKNQIKGVEYAYSIQRRK